MNKFNRVLLRLKEQEAPAKFSDLVDGECFRYCGDGAVYMKVRGVQDRGNVVNTVMLSSANTDRKAPGYHYFTDQKRVVYPATVEVTA